MYDNCLHILGGYPGPTMDLWKLSGVEPGGAGGQWQRLVTKGDNDEGNVPKERYQFSAVEHKGRVYVYGGYAKLGSKNLKDLWGLDLGGGGGIWRLLHK